MVDVPQRKTDESCFALMLKTLLIFMFIYKSTPIEGMTFITSERVAVLLFFFMAIIKKQWKVCFYKNLYIDKLWKYELIFQSFLLLYTIILILLIGWGDGDTLTEQIINFLVVTPIAVYSLSIVINSTEELLKILLVVTIFQSIVVLMGVLNPTVGDIIDNLQINKTYVYWDYPYYRSLGYATGIACVAAKGSLIMALGCIASYFFIRKKNKQILYWFAYLLISVAMTAVARTGLVFALIVLCFLIMDSSSNMNLVKRILILLSGLLFGIFITVLVISQGLLVDYSIVDVFPRVYDLYERGFFDSFFRYYIDSDSTIIPSVSWATIVGTNILSGTSGNDITVNVDGGYLRMYVALGIPLTMFFYLFQIGIMIKAKRIIVDKVKKTLAFLFILLMFLGEFKEFYFYLRYLIVIYFVYCHLVEIENMESTR